MKVILKDRLEKELIKLMDCISINLEKDSESVCRQCVKYEDKYHDDCCDCCFNYISQFKQADKEELEKRRKEYEESLYGGKERR